MIDRLLWKMIRWKWTRSIDSDVKEWCCKAIVNESYAEDVGKLLKCS